MQCIKKIDDEFFIQAMERVHEICVEPIRSHWDSSLFIKNRETLVINSERNVNDLRFKLGFDHIELLNSVMENKPDILLVSDTGHLRTLTVNFIFKISDIQINGKVRIYNVLNKYLESSYTLNLKNIKLKSIVGLRIEKDSYHVNNIIHELIDAKVSLVYKKNSEIIPVCNKTHSNDTKSSLVKYIVNNGIKSSKDTIEHKLHNAFHLTPVSISLGNLFCYRESFRKYTEEVIAIFNSLVDEVIDKTNLQFLEKGSKILLPNISVILNLKNNKTKSIQAKGNSLTGSNFLIRKKSVSIFEENNLLFLYVPVDFSDLNIKYAFFSLKYGNLDSRSFDIHEHYKTEGSYLTIVLQKLEQNNADLNFDLNLIDFKITNFIFLDSDNQSYLDLSTRAWLNSIFEFQIVPIIEKEFEIYLRIAMVSNKLNALLRQNI